MQIDSSSLGALNKIATAQSSSSGSGNQLTALQAKLSALLKRVTEIGLDSTLSEDNKKTMQSMLKLQIQMVMQQIQELKSEGKKGAAPASETLKVKPDVAPSSAGAAVATVSDTTTATTIDTYA